MIWSPPRRPIIASEAVCAECSRLACIRFEADDLKKSALTEAIACADLSLAQPACRAALDAVRQLAHYSSGWT
jgi:hypothetical protein